jgi:hypothetical protein
MTQLLTDSILTYIKLHEALEQEIADLSESDLTWKPSAAEWSVAEVLGHLADASVVHYYRARKIIAEPDNTIWPLYEQAAWVPLERANAIPAAESIAFFRAAARYNGQFYAGLSEADWSKSGVNHKGENVTLGQLFDSFIAHTHNHVRQIQRVKGALANRP